MHPGAAEPLTVDRKSAPTERPRGLAVTPLRAGPARWTPTPPEPCCSGGTARQHGSIPVRPDRRSRRHIGHHARELVRHHQLPLGRRQHRTAAVRSREIPPRNLVAARSAQVESPTGPTDQAGAARGRFWPNPRHSEGALVSANRVDSRPPISVQVCSNQQPGRFAQLARPHPGRIARGGPGRR